MGGGQTGLANTNGSEGEIRMSDGRPPSPVVGSPTPTSRKMSLTNQGEVGGMEFMWAMFQNFIMEAVKRRSLKKTTTKKTRKALLDPAAF